MVAGTRKMRVTDSNPSNRWLLVAKTWSLVKSVSLVARYEPPREAPVSVLGLEPLEKFPESPDWLPWRVESGIGWGGSLDILLELPGGWQAP